MTSLFQDSAEIPVVRIIGRLRGEKIQDDAEPSAGDGIWYLVHTSWTRRTYTLNQGGLDTLRLMDVTVIDNPDDYLL